MWRDREVQQAEGQAELDELTRRAGLAGLRLKASKRLRSSFESTKSTTVTDQESAPENRGAERSAKVAELAATQAEIAAMRANPPASNTPHVAAPLPGQRLIRTAVDAEVAAAEFMRRIGFADAKRTPSGADGGIDVIAAGAVAQVKTHMKPIGAPRPPKT